MFQEPWLWTVGALVVGALVMGIIWWVASRRPLRPSVERARKLFHLQRERLEFRFFSLASHSGKPRGAEWVECDFEDDVSFARDRHNGRLRAVVGVTVHFRPVEGGGMEDNPNVRMPKAGSVVFYLDGSDWGTDGKVHFNLNPAEAIRHFQQDLELVE